METFGQNPRTVGRPARTEDSSLALIMTRLVYDDISKDPGKSPRVLSVGAKGFEPSTSCTPCKHASRTAPRPDR